MKNLTVPHIKQSEESSCGAAALAMIYQYFGKGDQNERVIWERLKVHRPNTDNQYYLETPSMAQDASKQELSHFLAQAALDSPELALQPIREFVSLSIPVVVCQRISESNTLGHFRVITNIDEKDITFNDPMDDRGGTVLGIDKFMCLWSPANNGEVIGGEFLAIFQKELIAKESKFTVLTFSSPVKFYTATSLEFH